MCNGKEELVLKSRSVGDHGVRLVAEDQTLHICDAETGEEFAVLMWEYQGKGVSLQTMGHGTASRAADGTPWVFAPGEDTEKD